MTIQVKHVFESEPFFSKAPRRRTLQAFVACLLMLLSAGAVAAEQDEKEVCEVNKETCTFESSWITRPSFVDKVDTCERVPGTLPDSTFCDFYRFSWQNFLYLVSPVAGTEVKQGNAYAANFLDQEQFPALVSKQNPCTDKAPRHTFFRSMPTSLKPRALKSVDHSGPDRGPDIYQAGSNAVIYDQSHQAAVYSMRFSRNMCEVEDLLAEPYFPAGTTELKMAWKVLGEEDDPKKYFTVVAPEGSLGTAGTPTLGLIGLHIAVATKAHPEMIWITLEHNLNNPLCSGKDRFDPSSAAPAHSWSFTSERCARAKKPDNCKVNEPDKYKEKDAPETGKPTEICQVYPFGQLPDNVDPRDNNNGDNQAAISQLYEGFRDFVAGSKAPKWAKVWANYRMVGALWLSQPYLAPATGEFNSTCKKVEENGRWIWVCYEYGNPGNGTFQRGSLALANSVAETDFQGPVDKLVTVNEGTPSEKQVSALRNCFGCHGFTRNDVDFIRPIQRVQRDRDGQWKNLGEPWNPGTGTVSHIFGRILNAQCETLENPLVASARVSAGDAEEVLEACETTCEYFGGDKFLWTGKFDYIESKRSVRCFCCERNRP